MASLGKRCMFICTKHLLVHDDFTSGQSHAVQVYVQHKMRKVGKQLCQALQDDGGYIFVCGDGLHMAADVHAAIKEIIQEHAEFSAEEAEGLLRDLASEKRYVKDVWM